MVGQNLSIAVASACFYMLVWHGLASDVAVPVDQWRFWLPMIGLYIAAALNAGQWPHRCCWCFCVADCVIATVAALLDSVSLSKIWVPCVCAGDDVRLRHANACKAHLALVLNVCACQCTLTTLRVASASSYQFVLRGCW